MSNVPNVTGWTHQSWTRTPPEVAGRDACRGRRQGPAGACQSIERAFAVIELIAANGLLDDAPRRWLADPGRRRRRCHRLAGTLVDLGYLRPRGVAPVCARAAPGAAGRQLVDQAQRRPPHRT